jgi:hypothetical protein
MCIQSNYSEITVFSWTLLGNSVSSSYNLSDNLYFIPHTFTDQLFKLNQSQLKSIIIIQTIFATITSIKTISVDTIYSFYWMMWSLLRVALYRGFKVFYNRRYFLNFRRYLKKGS